MPPLSSVSSSQLSYEGPSMYSHTFKPLHSYCNQQDEDETSAFLSQSNMEVKPRLDLWSDNSSAWSLPNHEQQQQQQQHQQPNKKKGVHFARRDQFHEIIHVTEYSADEKQQCWYTRQERHQMVANRNACVARLDAWEDLAEDENVLYGLERTCETRRSMAQIHQAIHVVLSEQYDQRIYGMLDAEYIALRYKAVVDSFVSPKQEEQEMPNPVGILTEESVRYYEVAPMA